MSTLEKYLAPANAENAESNRGNGQFFFSTCLLAARKSDTILQVFPSGFKTNITALLHGAVDGTNTLASIKGCICALYKSTISGE